MVFGIGYLVIGTGKLLCLVSSRKKQYSQHYTEYMYVSGRGA